MQQGATARLEKVLYKKGRASDRDTVEPQMKTGN
jgi:hypothetical protein